MVYGVVSIVPSFAFFCATRCALLATPRKKFTSFTDSCVRANSARIRAITGVAAALSSGELILSTGDDNAEQRRALLAMPGIGPWTADYVRMRVTGDPDVFLPGDVAVRTGAGRLGLPDRPDTLASWAERAAPWRSYLTAHLWRAPAPLVAVPSSASTSGAPAASPTRATKKGRS